MNVNKKSKAFTIVEIIVVVIVIGILASITVVSYGQVTKNAREKSVAADAAGMRAAIVKYKAEHGSYPTNLSQVADKPSTSSTLDYRSYGGAHFCLIASNQNIHVYVSVKDKTPKSGTECSTPDIQTISDERCPVARIVAMDGRDNHTYWVQKLADNKCWMLTNLAYAGGGASTYDDVMPTGDGTGGTLSGPDNSGSYSYGAAKYYIPSSANPTTDPEKPSASVDGGTTSPQYGYFYNFCAANGGQQGSGACDVSTTAAVDQAVSICPANWRLPTSSNSGEFQALIDSLNVTSDSSGLTIFRSTWLAQNDGYWYNGFIGQGTGGNYWSQTQSSEYYAYGLNFGISAINSSSYRVKSYGNSVRCVAS